MKRSSPAAGLLLCAAVMLIDGYDLTAMALAVPHAARAFAVEPSRFGFALSAVVVGLGLGAIFLAPLGDRHGRRPTIIAAVALMGVATLGTATAGSVAALAGWRVLTGIGLGACLPSVTALTSELAPERRRAGMLTIVSCGISLGGVGAGLLAPALVAAGGWHGLFVPPGLFTLALLVPLALWLPETPGFARTAVAPRRSLFAPLAEPHRAPTMLFVGLCTLNSLVLYMLNSWLPTLLPQAGFTLAQAARFASLSQAGGIVASLLLSVPLDRGRPVAALGTAYLLVMAALASFGLLPATGLGWGLPVLIAGGGIAGAHLAIIAMGAGFYPPALRSSAIGLAVALARVGAIVGPLLGSQLIAAGIGPVGFFLAMVPLVGLCALVVLLVPRVSARVELGKV